MRTILRVTFSLALAMSACKNTAATSVDTFADGDFTANPVWTQVDVANGAWSAATQAAVFTASGASAKGEIYTPLSSVTEVDADYTITTNPQIAYLKLCGSAPTVTIQESGCYTVLVDLTAEENGDFFLYRDVTEIGTGNVNPLGLTFAFKLEITGGNVVVSVDGSPVITVADATYTSRSYVAIGFTGGALTVMSADNVAATFSAGPAIQNWRRIGF